ncbi:hypothetical protein OH77DRAFT_1518062 [Trametes cingulata]|nr:hypothetical protein OH77DRAFT_1518062 [Trametes cingulata]
MDGTTTVLSPQAFLDEFVPAAENSKPSHMSDIFRLLPKETNEKRMYAPLVKAINDCKDLCPGYTFVATPHRGDASAQTYQAVDCGMYPSDLAPAATVNKSGKRLSAATDWSAIEVSIECKAASGNDPFDDGQPDGEVYAAERRSTLGQILAYAQDVFEHQHRTFHFMILFISEDARILRFDRSSLFVSESFSYKTAGEPLVEFLWRVSRLSAEGRGHDTTAERIAQDSPYASLMRAKTMAPPQDYVTQLFKDSLDEAWPWWLLNFTDERTSKRRRFLVGKPHFTAQGLAGRGTRGYIALDFDNATSPLVFLKDSWRVVHDDIEKEGAILETLNANKVKCVPTLQCHGDLGQATVSRDLWYKYHPDVPPTDPCPLKEHAHYRLVVKEVGKPLTEFDTGYDLLFALYCVLKAHADAYKLGIIHRDISVGNILLYPDERGNWRGMLNDWELSKNIHSGSSDVGRQPDRTGTWQFLSVKALNDDEKVIDVPDELESVFHVLLYVAIRFLPHNCRRDDVGKFLYSYFDDCENTDKGYGCGEKKRNSMQRGEITFVQQGRTLNLRFYWSPGSDKQHPINEVIQELLTWFKAYYATHDRDVEDFGAGPGDAVLERPGTPQAIADDWDWGDDEQEESSSARPTDAPIDKANEGKASKLVDHSAMAKLFKRYLDTKTHPWPSKDKEADKRPKKGYKPDTDADRRFTMYQQSGTSSSLKRGAAAMEDHEPPSTPKH